MAGTPEETSVSNRYRYLWSLQSRLSAPGVAPFSDAVHCAGRRSHSADAQPLAATSCRCLSPTTSSRLLVVKRAIPADIVEFGNALRMHAEHDRDLRRGA